MLLHDKILAVKELAYNIFIAYIEHKSPPWRSFDSPFSSGSIALNSNTSGRK